MESRIKNLREKRGIIQEILAAELGITQQMLSKYEKDVTVIKVDNDDVLNEKINYEFDSVKRTLLLESRLRQNDVNEGIDISAINGKGYVMDEVLVPINMYTDMVRYEKQRVQIKGAKNLPFSEKYSRNVKKYINEILTGFSYVYDAFLELKDDSCFRDVIKKFSGVQVRHIIRNTDQYDTILRHSMHQEAAFQNYKFAFSLNKETEEHRYWEENGLFCADSMEELYKLRIMQKKAEAIEKV